MTFDEILTQVLTLLQREQRLSYRALQRRFALEEADLEALKDERIYAKRQAVDEITASWSGRVTLAQHRHQLPRPHRPPRPRLTTRQSGLLPTACRQLSHLPPEAERRQLTILFCDLVGSVPLSRQLDPEDYRAAVRAYQAACATVIERFDGYIAQYLGDGLLVYFGYPLAHEDDAQRAVRAGLAMVEAMGALTTRLEQQHGVRLAVRAGIHTGPVVVGEMGAGSRREQLAMGETPNIAARIQALAAPNTVAISAASQQLVQGYFVCDDLGAHVLKGVDTPLQVYRVLGQSRAQNRLDVPSPRGLTPLVGREAEVILLLDRWAQVTDGLGQVVLLSGEAGIGKSRLVQILKDHLAGEPHTRLECRCSPYHINSALYPVIDLWQRVLQFETAEVPADRLHRLEQILTQYRLPLAETVPLLASMLSLPTDRYPALALTPQRQKQKTLEALLALLVAYATQEPVLIVEDLHWVDPSTLEFLGLLVDQGPTARILTLCTFRPQFASPWLPRAHIAQLTLTRLPRPQVGEPSQHFAVLCTLWSFHITRAETQAAHAVVEQLLDLAQRQHDPAQLLEAHRALAITFANVGALALARTHHEQVIALYDAQQQVTSHAVPRALGNHGVSSRAPLALILWDLGYPDQAVQRSQEALTMAHTLAHPSSLREALRYSFAVHARRREWQTAQVHAEALLALATEHGFARYAAIGAYCRGSALAAQGQGAEGIAQMRQGLAAVRATGTVNNIPDHLARLAEAYGQVGQVDEGLHLLAEALALVGTTGVRRFEAELHRLHGELLLWQAVPDAPAAEACFQQALDVARHQQAKSWELRAAISLSRLWQRQGKRTEARGLLAPIYGWFTEGFDTPDLQDAKALLEELT